MVDGVISVRGDDAKTGSGGGSGGAIWIEAGTLMVLVVSCRLVMM